MRIVIDLQGAQTESRFRGIGRYSLELALAISRESYGHEIFIALNGLFAETIDLIRSTFNEIIPQENIRVWYAPGPVRENDPNNQKRREIAERIREAFLESLQADVILVTSLFEGFGDDAVTSVGILGNNTPTAVILYDLIPLISPDLDFTKSPLRQSYYNRKISSLKRCSVLFSISEYARHEGLHALDFSPQQIVNVSAACDASFRFLNLSDDEKISVRQKNNIKKPFIMYAGGADERKNLHRLVEAYASLPASIKKRHQLVFAGKMPSMHVEDLLRTAEKAGLAKQSIVFTGYIPDTDLVALYNSCELFVFPSLHEGFGMPPLEAMACGAPVIAANATSLPEVVGRSDALFDPRSVRSISKKIEEALTRSGFRRSLIEQGLLQAKRFSWGRSANRVLRTLEASYPVRLARTHQGIKVENTSLFLSNRKRILVLKLDHMGDFILAIPALRKLRSRYPTALIDALIGSWNLATAKELGIFQNIYTLNFFKSKSGDAPNADSRATLLAINQLGEYDLAVDLRRQRDTRHILIQIRAKIKAGYKCFDAEIDRSLNIALPAHADTPFHSTELNKTSIAIQMLRLIDALPFEIGDYFLSSKKINPNKHQGCSIAFFPFAGNDVKEWGADKYKELIYRLCKSTNISKINVYLTTEIESDKLKLENDVKVTSHIGLAFSDLEKSLLSNTVCVANNSFGAHLSSYLGLVTIGIYGGHETVAEWGPVFPNSYVIHTNAPCSPCHIPNRTECPHSMRCLEEITIDLVHKKILDAVEYSKFQGLDGINTENTILSKNFSVDYVNELLIESIAKLDISELSVADRAAIARCIATSIVPERANRQILIDISELVQRDVKTGIQRVTRALLIEMIQKQPKGWQISPVYATAEEPGYRYATQFASGLLDIPGDDLTDMPIEAWPGDIFLGLDLSPPIVTSQEKVLKSLHRNGVKIFFVIYDLLPLLIPTEFPQGASPKFRQWIQLISLFDGALTISKAVADEVYTWLQSFGERPTNIPFSLHWFHLGSDLEKSAPTFGLPSNAKIVLGSLLQRPTFLMVGTLEPRKGHLQVLAAFEQLWMQGVDVNLLIVGKQGWEVDELIQSLHVHPELEKRLFWFQGISDEYLKEIYRASTCLIAASIGEGFGLPLIEAARHGLPLLARDIPVFREVTEGKAYFFENSLAPDVISGAIRAWLDLYRQDKHPRSQSMPHQSWQNSAKQVIDILIKKVDPYKVWLPDRAPT